MDFKTLLPDFEAVKKTDWAKPQLKLDTKDYFGLAMRAGAVLMVVFVFLPWITVTVSGSAAGASGSVEASKVLGIATWYGVFAFLCAVAAVVGVVYNHTELALCAAVLGVIFGLLGVIIEPAANVEASAEFGGIKATAKSTVGHLGAFLYLAATVVTAAAAYLKITKK